MKTHWKKLDNPNYLGAYSLMDGETNELKMIIEKVIIEEVKTERGSENCKVAYLKGNKPMILNSTNCKTLENNFDTPFIEDWRGREVTLIVKKVRAFGEMIDALRIKPEKEVKKPELMPSSQKWNDAKKVIGEGTYTIEDLRRKYFISEKNAILLCSK